MKSVVVILTENLSADTKLVVSHTILRQQRGTRRLSDNIWFVFDDRLSTEKWADIVRAAVPAFEQVRARFMVIRLTAPFDVVGSVAPFG